MSPHGTGLPRPSTTRFVLLILVICAGSSFVAYWWLIARHGFWMTEQARCLAWLSKPHGGIADVNGFNQCITGLALRQEGAVLLGPVTVIVVSILATVTQVVVMLRSWGLKAPSPRLSACFESCLREVGIRRRPRLATVRRGASGGARVSGIYPFYWVLADRHRAAAAKDGRLAVMLRHEMAHLRAGDVDRALLARSAWGVFFALAAPALVFSVAQQGGTAWTQVVLRLGILLVLIYLTYRSLLRAREHEADLAADAAQARYGLDPDAPTLASVLAEPQRKDRLRRRWRLPPFLLAHPSPAGRIAVLSEPRLTARLSPAEFLSTGIAAGLIFQELAFAIGAVLPAHPEVAYWITGAVMAVPVCHVTITGIWRHELAGPGPLRHRAVILAGTLLGLGFLAGSQLSPRAAVDWGSVQLTVSPVLPSDLMLTAAGPLADAALAAAVMAGCALFMLWAVALVRELAPLPRRDPVRRPYRVSVALAVAVLAVPLGTWFLLCRLAGNDRLDPAAVPAADVLQGQLLFAALAAAAAVAFLSLLAAGIQRRGQAGSPLRRVTARAALSSGVLVMPFVALGSGAAIQQWFITPGPPIANYGGGSLPLLPPSVADSSSPLKTGITCWIFTHVPNSGTTDPATLRLLGRLLQRTPDRPLDLLGGEFTRVAQAPSSATTEGLIASVWLAALNRCDTLPGSALPPGTSVRS